MRLRLDVLIHALDRHGPAHAEQQAVVVFARKAHFRC
jgi:hypothetical protein